MAKLALCIKRADAPQNVIDAFNGNVGILVPIEASFWQTPVELVDRALCETDETWLQLLPYLAVDDSADSVFMYTRGGAGQEARLHGNYSIGVGGHVDVAPWNVSDLLSIVQLEAHREIMEEINVAIPSDDLTPSHFICDPTNPVGRVHLGLLVRAKLPASQVIDFVNGLEAGAIDNARMISYDELRQEPTYSRLEGWSSIIVDADVAGESTFATTGYVAALGASAEAGASDPDWDTLSPSAGNIGDTYRASENPDDAEEEEEHDDGLDTCCECDLLVEDCECDINQCDCPPEGHSGCGANDSDADDEDVFGIDIVPAPRDKDSI